MDPIIGGLITGGASLLGNIFSSNTSAANTQANIAAQEQMQQQTMNFNADQAQINRNFQEAQVNQQDAFQQQMSGSAYQRASADMKAAGLNPAMMFGSGAAASSPSGGLAGGSTASVGSPNMALSARTSPLAGLGDAVAKGISSAGAVQQLEKQTNEIEKSKWDAKSSYYDQYVKSMALPEAERKAAEQHYILAHPEDIERKAMSEYRGEEFGPSGSAANTVARGANTIKGVISDNVLPWFKDRIDEVTGPTGKALWEGARDAASRTFGRGKLIGPEGQFLDLKDFPSIRKTTLNPDYQ